MQLHVSCYRLQRIEKAHENEWEMLHVSVGESRAPTVFVYHHSGWLTRTWNSQG